MKALIQHLLTCYAHLVVRFLETQLIKRLLIRIYPRKIKIDGIKHLVIRYTALYYIIFSTWQSFTACRYKIKPFAIICIKHNTRTIQQIAIKIIDIQVCILSFTQKTLTIFLGLLTQRRQVKATSEIKMFT